MVKFYFKLGKTATEVYHDLKNVCSDGCVSRAQVCAFFQEGRESLEDDPSPGHPVSSWSNENVKKTHTTVMQEIRITTRLPAGLPGVGKEAASKIMERDLEKRKNCWGFVLHSLTVDQSE
jgi:hypothetical protein